MVITIAKTHKMRYKFFVGLTFDYYLHDLEREWASTINPLMTIVFRYSREC